MMRVVLVAEQLRRNVSGGIGTYLLGLLQGIAALDAPPEVTLHASRARSPRPDPLDSLGNRVAASRLPGAVLTRAWDRGLLRAPDADIVHAASFAFPPSRAPLVVMVHDLAWRLVPEAYPPRGRRWHEQALARSIVRADRFVAPSEDTADALVSAGARADRVEIIEEGCDHLPAADVEGARGLLRTIGAHGDYLLTVGTLEPRKNLARLAAAYEVARTRLPEPWPLVVVGPRGWGEHQQPPPGVLIAGTVSDAVLAGLYRRARCVAYVPLVEGFGLPAVEAMRECAPVVSSGVPSAGAATLLVDPLDVEAIADGLVRASTEEALRSELVTAGLLRAGELTWARAAQRHVDLWEATAA